MQRYDIINTLIKKNNYQSYLEIGVQNKKNWNQISCQYKVGVDPDPNVNTTFNVTSDEFFKNNKDQFDIIFVDGLHIHPQPYNDIINSLACLKENGIIVVHDCNPEEYEHQAVPRISKYWTGDVWKSIARLRYERDDLEMYTVDTDCGCCLIKKGQQEKLLKLISDWDDFQIQKNIILNTISVERFTQLFL